MAETEIIYPLFKCSSKLSNSYGIHAHIGRKGIRYDYDTREQDLSMIGSVGVPFVRADCDWIYLKSNLKDDLNYLSYDSVIMSVNRHHNELLGILGMDWRLEVSNEWQNYVTTTCSRYRKNIFFWEMLNEADLMHRFRTEFTYKHYLEFLKHGYSAVKSGNKKAKVLFSGIAYAEGDFIDSVLSQNVSNYFDIMNVHHYTDVKREPEEFLFFYKRLYDKLKKYDIDKPLWLTETGCFNTIGRKNDTIAGKRLPRIFLISFACGVEKVFWYKSRARELDPNDGEDFYGLWHKDFSPKPAYYSYKTLIKMCPNKSTRPKLRRDGNVYTASWKHPDGKKAWALWTSKEKDKVNLEIKGKFMCYDDKGNVLDIEGNNLDITNSVIYIIGAKSVVLNK